jgi:hypothetical protein
MWFNNDKHDPDETDPRESEGLAELDRITYHVRKLLKVSGISYSFQDPPHSKRSATLVLRSAEVNLPQPVEDDLISVGFVRELNYLYKFTDNGIQLIVAFPRVDTQDGKKDRLAIRMAYQLPS